MSIMWILSSLERTLSIHFGTRLSIIQIPVTNVQTELDFRMPSDFENFTTLSFYLNTMW